MAKLSNVIEEFIKEMIREAEDMSIEIRRNELAERFNCAPSQINYVLTTRFTTDKGYYIESRRGGGGYIRIVKSSIESDEHICNVICNMIGDSMTTKQASGIIEQFLEEGVIGQREAAIMKSAISSRVLQNISEGNRVRADIVKNMLLVLVDKS